MICDDEDVLVLPGSLLHIQRSGTQTTAQQFGVDWNGPIYARVFEKGLQPKAYIRSEMPRRRRAWRRLHWPAGTWGIAVLLVGLLMALALWKH